MSNVTTPNFSIDLTGQVALVTGASAGLGARMARALASCGATLIVTARRLEKLQSLAIEIRAHGGTCHAYEMDMSNRRNVRSVLQHVEEAYGCVTILVNNAGITDAVRAVKMTDEQVDRLMETNLTGPFILSCEVASRLMRNELPGRVINISSMAAYDIDGDMGAALYSVTKAGMVRMTEVLAIEWAKNNINVNCIAPGMFYTEMVAGMFDKVGDNYSANFPRKRICNPEQLDSTLLYLVSPSSDCVTGAVIKVDDAQHHR